MKNIIIISALLFAFAFVACQEETKVELPEGYRMVIVKEMQDAGRYVYMRVDDMGEERWVASYIMDAQPGDTLYYSQADEMKEFYSESLDKTFPSLWMVQDMTTELPKTGGEMGENMEHPDVTVDKAQEISVEPAEGGKTVAQIFEQKDKLKDNQVIVRGVVTKVNNNIMFRNWLHIQDGTSNGDHYDLVVTTDQEVQQGDTVTVTGKLAIDKDFGSGYKYDVIVEEAKVEGGTKADGQAI